MADSFRALCAELVDALDSGIPTGRICMSPLANRARAALAEPDGCDFPVCIDDDSEEGTCSRWLAGSCEGPASAARAARRPKPPSLKEQALAKLDAMERLWEASGNTPSDKIRRALEALPND